METQQWYLELAKPEWAPPTWLFGPVWSMLYLVIAVTFTFVFVKAWRKQIPAYVAVPFALNLVFNLLFTPIQFGLQNNLLAAIDIALVLATLVWALVVVYPYSRIVVYANAPYLLWVSFATLLQLTITYLNW